MTKNLKQSQIRRDISGQIANPYRDQDTISNNHLGSSSNHAKTADSGQLKVLEEFAGKLSGLKKYIPKIKLPLNTIFFDSIPKDVRKSFISMGDDASPIAEESSRVTWESENKTLQQSPSI